MTEGVVRRDYPALPSSAPDPESEFGVDSNINMETIDQWLGRPDVAYRDMRLVRDPADYAAIGGSSLLDFVLEGFKVVPWPYIATLPTLPIGGAYAGDTLFSVTWGENGQIVSATPRYEESTDIIAFLFPRDQAIFLMCGGAGYAGQMKTFLIHLGWDESLLYNVGGAWSYDGYHSIQIVTHADDLDKVTFDLWKLDQATIDFSQLTPMAGAA